RVLTEACACRTHTRRALPTRRASDLIEAGRAVAIGENLSLTPQAQLSYSKVDFDGFADRFGAAVGLDRSEALQGRLGLSLDHKRSEEHTSELQSRENLACRPLVEKKN